ncbi:MAG: succinate dehydrogenase assembly factor 2 [candidate division WOR-3 bacterium]|nr:succinate dehydrogenase assembly factor 2 [candidate division WOR-3 bacterium]MDW8150009.1 succinate dehydrogenase assembly factor 2 [candidate division WOR-3 bacterium]
MYGDYNDDTIQVQNLRKKAKFLILYRGTKEAEELLKKFYLDEIDNMTKEELIELIEFLEKDDFTILEKLIK